MYADAKHESSDDVTILYFFPGIISRSRRCNNVGFDVDFDHHIDVGYVRRMFNAGLQDKSMRVCQR